MFFTVCSVCSYASQGVSRSAAVVIAYLIYTHNMSYDAAFDLVKRKRACVKPNSGFVKCVKSSIAPAFAV